MASGQSRRDVLRFLLGGGVLGLCRALFGAVLPPVQAAAAVPPTVVPPVTACPTGELLSVTTYVYDARGRMCMENRWSRPRLVGTSVYKLDDAGTDPTPPPAPRADDQSGGNAQT